MAGPSGAPASDTGRARAGRGGNPQDARPLPPRRSPFSLNVCNLGKRGICCLKVREQPEEGPVWNMLVWAPHRVTDPRGKAMPLRPLTCEAKLPSCHACASMPSASLQQGRAGGFLRRVKYLERGEEAKSPGSRAPRVGAHCVRAAWSQGGYADWLIVGVCVKAGFSS